MNQKPSARIESWRKFFEENRPEENGVDNMFSAIVTYLNEEFEKQQVIINSDKTGKVGMV